ncbi:hypothetical protein CLF_106930 [Clonorchis sinensis]|uniref:Uncharacterized protein n=1 Tax=Clonorchis sinensis TaxID=79923 RepID=G7YFY1_CLOSI|nr:hypothetical protein CLF_106930 [Clonorchis sinensis]
MEMYVVCETLTQDLTSVVDPKQFRMSPDILYTTLRIPCDPEDEDRGIHTGAGWRRFKIWLLIDVNDVLTVNLYPDCLMIMMIRFIVKKHVVCGTKIHSVEKNSLPFKKDSFAILVNRRLGIMNDLGTPIIRFLLKDNYESLPPAFACTHAYARVQHRTTRINRLAPVKCWSGTRLSCHQGVNTVIDDKVMRTLTIVARLFITENVEVSAPFAYNLFGPSDVKHISRALDEPVDTVPDELHPRIPEVLAATTTSPFCQLFKRPVQWKSVVSSENGVAIYRDLRVRDIWCEPVPCRCDYGRLLKASSLFDIAKFVVKTEVVCVRGPAAHNILKARQMDGCITCWLRTKRRHALIVGGAGNPIPTQNCTIIQQDNIMDKRFGTIPAASEGNFYRRIRSNRETVGLYSFAVRCDFEISATTYPYCEFQCSIIPTHASPGSALWFLTFSTMQLLITRRAEFCSFGIPVLVLTTILNL